MRIVLRQPEDEMRKCEVIFERALRTFLLRCLAFLKNNLTPFAFFSHVSIENENLM